MVLGGGPGVGVGSVPEGGALVDPLGGVLDSVGGSLVAPVVLEPPVVVDVGVLWPAGASGSGSSRSPAVRPAACPVPVTSFSVVPPVPPEIGWPVSNS